MPRRTVDLRFTECASCAVPYSLPACLIDNRRATGDPTYCPNGHANYWKPIGTVQELQRDLSTEKQRATEALHDLEDTRKALAEKERELQATLMRLEDKDL